jgi:prepilin-type N-terminal cleavage/methylation domain-containing protein
MRHTSYKTGNTKYAFTLVEILIVVGIIGILAALVLPTLQGHIQQAKEAAAKDNLRILRNTIEVYAAQHNGVPPGYNNDNPTGQPAHFYLMGQLVTQGHYLLEFPKNPFNDTCEVKAIGNNEDFPTEPLMTDVWGWIYKPATKTIKLNQQGTDSQGVAYFDY